MKAPVNSTLPITAVSDCTVPNAHSYMATVRRDGLVAYATITHDSLIRGMRAYVLSSHASKAAPGPLGARQQEAARPLLFTARAALLDAMAAAGWEEKDVKYLGRRVTVYLPPKRVTCPECQVNETIAGHVCEACSDEVRR